jgi:protein involved in plasmid replication-relaxation
MRRSRSGKRIELTSRDLEIFRLMARYRYLSSTYIYAFVGGASEKRFKERLGDLFHEGYLDRPGRQWDMANCRHRPAIHELDDGAKRVLDQQGILENRRTWLGSAAHRQFPHSLMICETIASIELGTRMIAGMRFIPWPEILTKAPAETRALAHPFRFPTLGPAGGVAPDALFGIEYRAEDKKTYRFFALEADRGTMPVARSNPDQTSYLGKLAAYHGILSSQAHKTHLGVPNLLVLTVTTSERRLGEIMQRLTDQRTSTAAFLFKAFNALGLTSPAPQLFSEPWQRCDLPPLRIDC